MVGRSAQWPDSAGCGCNDWLSVHLQGHRHEARCLNVTSHSGKTLCGGSHRIELIDTDGKPL